MVAMDVICRALFRVDASCLQVGMTLNTVLLSKNFQFIRGR